MRPTSRQLTDRRDVIRELLRKHPDGLTDKEVIKRAGIRLNLDKARRLLENMGDAYVDRWVPGSPKFPWRPVWCVVDVPPHCPRPDTKGETQ